MTIIYSFLFCGLICFLGQLILDNTNFTPGHVTSLFVVVGSFLSFIELYPKLVKIVGAGSNIPIMSFGNILTNGVYKGYLKNGFLGLFDNVLGSVSLGISSVLIFSFVFTLFFKAKD